MKTIVGIIAATLIAGSAFAQTATQQNPQVQKPLLPWQRTTIQPAPAPAAVPVRPTAPAVQTPAAANQAVAPGQDAKGAGAARRTQCSQEYQANKEAIKAQYGTWNKYYSACNTRIKTTGR